MVDTRRKPFDELTSKQKLFSVIIPTVAALWSIFGGMYSFSQAVLAYSTLSSTAADVFSMVANFESAPIIDATLSTVACADLAASSDLAWEGLTVMDRFKKTGASISGSNEKDRSFTGRWQGAAAYCMCGTKDFPARTAAEKQAMKHTCNATTYDVSEDDPSLGCLKSSSTASGTATGGNTKAGGSTVNTGSDGTIYSHLGTRLCPHILFYAVFMFIRTLVYAFFPSFPSFPRACPSLLSLSCILTVSIFPITTPSNISISTLQARATPRP